MLNEEEQQGNDLRWPLTSPIFGWASNCFLTQRLSCATVSPQLKKSFFRFKTKKKIGFIIISNR